MNRAPELAAYAGDIARAILGEPNRALSTRSQLRFGKNGSVAVEIAGPKRGEWFDHENQIGGGMREMIVLKDGVREEDVDRWLTQHSFPSKNGHDHGGIPFNIVKTYDYRDEQGELLFQVCRLVPKDFRQRAPNGSGGWVWKTSTIRKVLYRLPELIATSADEIVFVCEGEKDADRLVAGGLIATTNPGGAATPSTDGRPSKPKWLPSYNAFFAGRRVVILPHNDEPGRAHAQTIAASLAPIAARVAILELPDLPDKGDDVSVWLDAGGTIEQLVALAEEQLAAAVPPKTAGQDAWPEPDMGVLLLHRRSPPNLPLNAFGPAWSALITTAAEAAACPPDYIVAPLLTSVSALIGHARWAQASPGWAEPPHLWVGAVGDSGNGKSPGADCLLRDVLPEIEQRMAAEFPERLREWRASVEFENAAEGRWKSEVQDAQKSGAPAPLPPVRTAGPEPQAPRLRQNDVTIEKVAVLLATAALKGLLIVRDELSGWIAGMNSYNDAGRSFWVEAYGGRPYRVERVKHPEPIDVPRLAVAVYGTTQPDKLALLMRDADDGLLARMLWTWPKPIPFRLGRQAPGAHWVIGALDRLRELDLQPGEPPSPVMVPLTEEARSMMEEFGREMQQRQEFAGGLMRSACGKARGQALRLALLLEFMWWCGQDGMAPPPTEISPRAFATAAMLIDDYFLPMAERVYGDASTTGIERNTATLARWIVREKPTELHVRHLQRDVRLPGLRSADEIKAAATALIEADWLRPPDPKAGFVPGRAREVYSVNPKLLAVPS